MKKRIIALLAVLVLLICAVPCFYVSAETGSSADTETGKTERLDDGADLLDSSEETEISRLLDAFRLNHNFDIVIVTTESRGSKSIEKFGENYYDTHGYGDDGILLVIDMSDRSWDICLTGEAEYIWGTDRAVSSLEESFVSYLSSGRYSSAFKNFVSQVEEDYNGYTGPASHTPGNLLKSLFFGILIGLIIAWVMTHNEEKKLTSVAFQKNANQYVVDDSFRLLSQNDVFLYRTVSRVRVNNDSSGGGHRGGGGHHGGGGGHHHTSHSGHF